MSETPRTFHCSLDQKPKYAAKNRMNHVVFIIHTLLEKKEEQ
jgi:hypothetical protein